MEILAPALTLFLVMDPLGNLPVFLSVLEDVPPARRRRILVRELLLALAVLLVFLFAGQALLGSFGLRPETIRIAGGIVLFLIALRMIFPSEGGVAGEAFEGEPFLVPLAIPLVAGPSALAAVLLVRSQSGGLRVGLLALLAAWAATAAILLASPVFYRLLRRRGLAAMERLMGMLLVMLAVQMFLDGLAARLGP